MKVAMICDVMGQPNNGTTLAALNLICPSGSGTPVP